MSDDKDDEVGYGKPPKHGQFPEGQSGNPKGRPKGQKNIARDIQEIMNMPTSVKMDGKVRKVPTRFAILLRCRQNALEGNGRAADKLFEMDERYNNTRSTAFDAKEGYDRIQASGTRAKERLAKMLGLENVEASTDDDLNKEQNDEQSDP